MPESCRLCSKSNSLGVLQMGCRCDKEPGFVNAKKAGKNYSDIMTSGMKAALRCRQCASGRCRKSRFRRCRSQSLTDSLERADIVLPSAGVVRTGRQHSEHLRKDEDAYRNPGGSSVCKERSGNRVGAFRSDQQDQRFQAEGNCIGSQKSKGRERLKQGASSLYPQRLSRIPLYRPGLFYCDKPRASCRFSGGSRRDDNRASASALILLFISQTMAR